MEDNRIRVLHELVQGIAQKQKKQGVLLWITNREEMDLWIWQRSPFQNPECLRVTDEETYLTALERLEGIVNEMP